MTLRRLPAAVRETEEAWAWYARQSGEAALRFLDAPGEAYAEIEGHPSRFPTVGGVRPGREVRFTTVRDFPYSVIYEVKPEEVIVLAVAHNKRRSGYWSRRKG